ncbi:hypothetical protein K438DRAFT_2136695 [Mycena galopus ATCC 62051]|nr:hypothetical protein K438DRAFT_2136695 [Mycena galopus ATCC 62051]
MSVSPQEPSSRSLELAPELTDLIVSNIEGDRALRTCSLVCRAWRSPSRARLYRRLRLRGKDISDFLDLITSPDNTYVYALLAIELEEGGECTVRVRELLARLPEFFRLKRLGFATLVVQFPGLKTLELDGIRWTDPSPSATQLTAALLPLNELKIDSTFLEHQCSRDWLCSDSESAGLVARRLILVVELSGMDSATAGGLSEFLRRLGVHLTSLAIHIKGHDVPSSLVDIVDFSANTALRSLRIDGAIDFDVVDDGGFEESFLDISRQLVSLLGGIQATCLEQLIIGFRIHWCSSLLIFDDRDPAPLDHLVRIFDHPAYSTLEEIQFVSAWDQSWGLEKPEFDEVELNNEMFTEIVGYHRREFTQIVLPELPRSVARSVLFVHEECNEGVLERAGEEHREWSRKPGKEIFCRLDNGRARVYDPEAAKGQAGVGLRRKMYCIPERNATVL